MVQIPDKKVIAVGVVGLALILAVAGLGNQDWTHVVFNSGFGYIITSCGTDSCTVTSASMVAQIDQTVPLPTRSDCSSTADPSYCLDQSKVAAREATSAFGILGVLSLATLTGLLVFIHFKKPEATIFHRAVVWTTATSPFFLLMACIIYAAGVHAPLYGSNSASYGSTATIGLGSTFGLLITAGLVSLIGSGFYLGWFDRYIERYRSNGCCNSAPSQPAQQQATQPAQQPQPGSPQGYPPQGAQGYPPQGAQGYPPQGTPQGYPQGGQYPPPQGGQYPPQEGGQYPPQGGQYPPQGPPQGHIGYPSQQGSQEFHGQGPRGTTTDAPAQAPRGTTTDQPYAQPAAYPQPSAYPQPAYAGQPNQPAHQDPAAAVANSAPAPAYQN